MSPRNERGFLTLDFIFALTVSLGFAMVFFSVAITLSLVEIGQYVTFATSRAYAGAHESKDLQEDLGRKKFAEVMAQPAFKTFLGQSFMKVGQPELGNFKSGGGNGDEYPEDSAKDNDIFVGARVSIDAALLHLRVPFLGSTAEDAGVGKAVLNSYLMREVSSKECRDFNSRRFSKLKGLATGGGSYAGGSNEHLITDNGC